MPTALVLQYEDVELVTPDNVKLQSYLLLQRKEILYQPGVGQIDYYDDETDEEVCSLISHD